MRFRQAIILAMTVAVLASVGCSTSGSKNTEEKELGAIVYNRFNIHVVRSPDRGQFINRASYANWVDPVSDHWIVPANSKLKVVYRRRGIFPGYEMTVVDTGQVVNYEFNARNTGMTAVEYLQLITAPNPTSHAGLTEKDKQGVKEGKAMVGMTKMGVRIALGHPAKHRTPSLKSDTWVYWKDRYRTMVVEFEDDKVKTVR